jgi:hypothetical protein
MWIFLYYGRIKKGSGILILKFIIIRHLEGRSTIPSAFKGFVLIFFGKKISYSCAKVSIPKTNLSKSLVVEYIFGATLTP